MRGGCLSSDICTIFLFWCLEKFPWEANPQEKIYCEAIVLLNLAKYDLDIPKDCLHSIGCAKKLNTSGIEKMKSTKDWKFHFLTAEEVISHGGIFLTHAGMGHF